MDYSKMKSLDLKIEKANSIFKHRRLFRLTNLFRFMEAFAFLLFMISRFSFSYQQLPLAAVKVSGDYFRGITLTVLSPKFVFLIGNLIILILFLKSRASSENINNGDGKTTDLCYDYVETTIVASSSNSTSNSIVDFDNKKKTKICRSRSENPIRKEKKTHRELRRSVTEIGRSESFGRGGDTAARCVKEELSSEDFRRTVEEFIARQQKILRDEEFSPMVYIGA